MKNLTLLILFFTTACTSRVPTIRTPYELSTQNDFIVSNMYTDPVRLDRTEEGLEIKYDITVKNLRPSERVIDLDGAALVSREKASPMKCVSFENQKEKFSVKVNETFRVQCKGILHKLSNTRSDIKLYIAIPLDGSLTKFSYIVRAEELQ